MNLEYEGDFVNDQRSGYGVLKTTKGIYRGEFKEGRFHGEGKFSFLGGRVKEGVWERG